MTTPTPELVTAEQAREYIRSLSLLPEIDKTQIVRLAESAFHTIIALHEALAAEKARAVCPIGILPEAQKLCSAGTCDVCTASLRDRLVAAEARHDDDRHELNRLTAELGAANARADAAEARVAVRVKPLVWGPPLCGFYTVNLPFDGKIAIMRNSVRGIDIFILYPGESHRSHYPTLEAAQAAAQADYEARIRAALETGERIVGR